MSDCRLCKKPFVLRTGPYGEFMGCSGFPACNNTLARQRQQGRLGGPGWLGDDPDEPDDDELGFYPANAIYGDAASG